jgi:hypothetical protein
MDGGGVPALDRRRGPWTGAKPGAQTPAVAARPPASTGAPGRADQTARDCGSGVFGEDGVELATGLGQDLEGPGPLVVAALAADLA